MSDQAQGDHRELEAIQRQLADTRQHIAELEALISDLPEIYERKFEQQLQPLLEQERLLLQQNLLLRDQLQRALPGTASQLLLAPAPVQAPAPPTQAPATPGQEGAALGPGVGTGPLQPPAQPQPAQPPASLAETPPTAPGASPRAPEPPGPAGPGQGSAASGLGQEPGRQQPRYRLALVATVAALGAFGLLQRQLVPGNSQRTAAAQRSTQGSRQAPASAVPSHGSVPGSTAQPVGPARVMELQVIARGSSWIELRDAQGRTVYADLLEGRKRFRLGTGLSLKAGRPELVQVQLGAGPAQVLPPGEWWTWHRFQPPGA